MLYIYNRSKNTTLGNRIALADTFLMRFRGLLGRKTLEQGEGLLLQPCQGVHGWGMRFSCDVVYLNHQDQVVYLQTLRPGALAPYKGEAWRILEIPAGTIAATRTTIGDFVTVHEQNNLPQNTM